MPYTRSAGMYIGGADKNIAGGHVEPNEPSKLPPKNQYSITLDGKRPEDLGFKLLRGRKVPGTPSTKDYIMDMPGVDGAYDYGADNKPLPFGIPLGALRKDPASLHKTIRGISAHLRDSQGQPRNMKLVFDWEPEVYYYVRYSGSLPVERLVNLRMGKLTVPLTAFDGCGYAESSAFDPEESYFYGARNYDAGDYYYDNPQSFDWFYPKQYSGIMNYSPYNTDFIIKIDGTVTNPSVTNLVTGEKLTLPSISNGTIEVNSKRFTVKKNGISTLKTEDTNSNFFDIQPGEVGFLFEGENPNATVTYQWLHKYL